MRLSVACSHRRILSYICGEWAEGKPNMSPLEHCTAQEGGFSGRCPSMPSCGHIDPTDRTERCPLCGLFSVLALQTLARGRGRGGDFRCAPRLYCGPPPTDQGTPLGVYHDGLDCRGHGIRQRASHRGLAGHTDQGACMVGRPLPVLVDLRERLRYCRRNALGC